MASFSCTSQSNTTLTFTLSGISADPNPRYVKFFWKKVGGTYASFQTTTIPANSTANVVTTIGNSTPLNQGASYNAYVTLRFTNVDTGVLNYTSTVATGTTNIPSPNGVTVVSVTDTSISLDWGSVTNAVDYTVRLQFNHSGIDITWTYTATSSAKVVTGLYDNTNYMVDVRTNGEDKSSTYCLPEFPSTLITILPWDWYVAKNSNTDIVITVSEWWDFMLLINEVRNRYGLGDYGFNWSFSYYQSGQSFYAWMMTQTATAIYQINSNMGGIDLATRTVASGDDMYASYFLDLKTALNICINAL